MSLYSWQVQLWQHYKTARDSQYLSHALLLVGNAGIGKQHFANLLAQSLLCEEVNERGFACSHCKSCRVHMSHAHPDFKRVELDDGKKQIPVDVIRRLTDFLTLSRSYQGYRVVIIEHADKMNLNAANSLLKGLEEPALRTVIILIVDQLEKILPTIKSRCQIFYMNNPTEKQSLEWINQQNTTSSPHILLSLADNKPILALQLDQHSELIQQRNDLAVYIMGILKNTQSITSAAKQLEKVEVNWLLNWQLKWVQQFIKQRVLKADITQDKDPILVEMNVVMKRNESAWMLYKQLIELKSVTDYPLNRIIFVESMLLLWRAFASS